MTHLANIDKDYASWIEELSQRYKHSQIKAATHVNSEMLLFYWSLGKDIVMLHAESRWGDKILKLLSSDLQTKLPGIKGLSETSIGYAKRFYLLYNEWFTIHPQVGGELQENAIWRIPWGHHKYIIDKCFNEPEKAMFFVRKTLEGDVLCEEDARKRLEPECPFELYGYRPLRTAGEGHYQLQGVTACSARRPCAGNDQRPI